VIAIGLPLAAFLILAGWWAWVGRDPRPGTIVPRWSPPDLPPGPSGTLVDQRAELSDVLATILDLAARGYLVIREVHPSGVPAAGGADARVARRLLETVGLWRTEWQFARGVAPMETLKSFEAGLVVALLADADRVTLSNLRPIFAERLPAVRASLYDDLVRRGLFAVSPEETRHEWVGLGAAFAAAGGVAAVFLQPALAAGLALTGGVVILFARWMPVVTRSGAAVRDELLGLREYLARAEREELAARYDDLSTPAGFDAVLPYAIALGVSDVWLSRFAAPLAARPWYEVVGAETEPTAFGERLGVFCRAATDALAGARLDRSPVTTGRSPG